MFVNFNCNFLNREFSSRGGSMRGGSSRGGGDFDRGQPHDDSFRGSISNTEVLSIVTLVSDLKCKKSKH